MPSVGPLSLKLWSCRRQAPPPPTDHPATPSSTSRWKRFSRRQSVNPAQEDDDLAGSESPGATSRLAKRGALDDPGHTARSGTHNLGGKRNLSGKLTECCELGLHPSTSSSSHLSVGSAATSVPARRASLLSLASIELSSRMLDHIDTCVDQEGHRVLSSRRRRSTQTLAAPSPVRRLDSTFGVGCDTPTCASSLFEFPSSSTDDSPSTVQSSLFSSSTTSEFSDDSSCAHSPPPLPNPTIHSFYTLNPSSETFPFDLPTPGSPISRRLLRRRRSTISLGRPPSQKFEIAPPLLVEILRSKKEKRSPPLEEDRGLVQQRRSRNLWVSCLRTARSREPTGVC